MTDRGWFKSSHSGAANEECVEVRLTEPVVGVRDSKDRHGPALAFSPVAWRGLLGTAKSGRLDPQ